MAVIGATQIEPVNILGSYVQGRELGRANQLARQQEAERMLAMQEQQQLKNALAGGLDIRTPEGQAALVKFGPQGIAMAAQGAQLGQYDFQAKQAERAAAREKLGELIGILRFGEKDDESYAIAYQTAKARGFDMTGVPTTRNLAYIQGQLQSLIPLDKQLELEMRRETAEIQRGQLDVSRGQLDLAKRKQDFEERGGGKREKAPEGYRWTPEGNLEYIKGGPKDPANIAGTATELPPKVRAKREELYPKATTAVNSAVRDIDNQIALAKRLRDHPGLGAITGSIDAITPNIRDVATSAQSDYNTLLSQGTLSSLTRLRAASETGGALGNVSNQDTNLLRDSVGSLSQSQGKEALQSNLNQYISDLEFARDNVQNAYNETYAYRMGASEQGVPTKPRRIRGDPSKRKPSDAAAVMKQADAILGL